MKDTLKRIERLPIPVVATTVGACTLSNVYNAMGFPIIRHITMIFGTIILFAYLYKIFKYTNAVKNDYKNIMLASLYGVVSMLIMLLSSYYIAWFPIFKYVMIFAVILHAIHICVFLYMYLFKNFDKVFFIPSWFVTLNGIMVSTVVGYKYLPPIMAQCIFYYGVTAYTIFIPFMIVRLKTVEIKPPTYHTQAILIAPASLIVASYLNLYETPNMLFVSVYYACVVLSVLFVIYKLPSFFSFKFAPQYAGLTFPMAIGIVASKSMSGFLTNSGYESLGFWVNQFAGIQIYLTTAIISFVLFNFLIILTKKVD